VGYDLRNRIGSLPESVELLHAFGNAPEKIKFSRNRGLNLSGIAATELSYA
jgi:hypothetical protein